MKARFPPLITDTPFALIAGGNAAQNHPFSFCCNEFTSNSYLMFNDPGRQSGFGFLETN